MSTALVSKAAKERTEQGETIPGTSPKIIRVVCVSCNTLISEKHNSKVSGISHSICPSCIASRLKRTLKEA